MSSTGSDSRNEIPHHGSERGALVSGSCPLQIRGLGLRQVKVGERRIKSDKKIRLLVCIRYLTETRMK